MLNQAWVQNLMTHVKAGGWVSRQGMGVSSMPISMVTLILIQRFSNPTTSLGGDVFSKVASFVCAGLGQGSPLASGFAPRELLVVRQVSPSLSPCWLSATAHRRDLPWPFHSALTKLLRDSEIGGISHEAECTLTVRERLNSSLL